MKKFKLNQKGYLGLVIFLVILAALILSGYFIAVNLSDSLPGDFIYPIKRIHGNLRLAVNDLNSESRALVFADLADIRLREFEKLVKKRDFGKTPHILDEIVLMQKKALEDLGYEQSRGTNIIADAAKLETGFTRQRDTLKKLYFEASPDAYSLMDQTIESMQEDLNAIDSLKGRR